MKAAKWNKVCTGYECVIFSGEDDFDPEETKNMSKERVLEAIRQKKEVITKLRSQPWSMKRKLRTLK